MNDYVDATIYKIEEYWRKKEINYSSNNKNITKKKTKKKPRKIKLI